MTKELSIIKKYYNQLLKSDFKSFDLKNIPLKQGVYIIFNKKNVVVHVGRTVRGKRGLKQRIANHLQGKSSFVRDYLNGKKEKLIKDKYRIKYLIVDNDRIRALLEAYAIGNLCPKHIGLGK